MAGGGVVYRMDAEAFWVQRLKSGQAPEPEYAYVPAEEQYDMNDPKNIWREIFGRHRCLACNKPFWSQEASFNCHHRATAYIVWRKFAHRGPAGAASISDVIRGSICNPHNSGGYYSGGPFGL